MSEFLTSIKRTPYQSLASFLTLFFTLFLSLFFFTLISFFNGVLTYVETKPHITVYFQKQATEKDIFALRDNVQKGGKVSTVKYISKVEALKIYKDLNRDDPLLLEMVSAEILPASLEIYTKRPEYLNELTNDLQDEEGVDEVVFQKDIVDKLLSVTTILRRVSLFTFLFLLVNSFFVLMTTTAFKIALKKDEIELMKLLGATTSYIRKPFVLEGLLFGFLSASIAFLLFFIIFFSTRPFLSSYLVGIPQLPFYNLGSYGFFIWPPSVSFLAGTYAVTVFFGALIGLVGNYFSTSKYIK